MAEYLARYSAKAPLVRLKRADSRSPGTSSRPGVKVMAKIDPAALDPRQREFLQTRAKARQLHEQDPYEIAEHDW